MAAHVSSLAEDTFTLESVIRGHHVYKAIWIPQHEELLGVAREDGNEHDHYAVRVFKSGTGTVGHVPREYSRMFYFFLQHCGIISCEVTGHRKKGHGLEVPCKYYLTGGEKMVMKAKEIVEDIVRKNEKKKKDKEKKKRIRWRGNIGTRRTSSNRLIHCHYYNALWQFVTCCYCCL